MCVYIYIVCVGVKNMQGREMKLGSRHVSLYLHRGVHGRVDPADIRKRTGSYSPVPGAGLKPQR